MKRRGGRDLRARAKITSHFAISASAHLWRRVGSPNGPCNFVRWSFIPCGQCPVFRFRASVTTGQQDVACRVGLEPDGSHPAFTRWRGSGIPGVSNDLCGFSFLGECKEPVTGYGGDRGDGGLSIALSENIQFMSVGKDYGGVGSPPRAKQPVHIPAVSGCRCRFLAVVSRASDNHA